MVSGTGRVRPAGRSQHLQAPLRGHATVGFPGQKNLSHNQKDPTTSIRKTQTNTRPGDWLPWGWGDAAPPNHTEPETQEASGVALGWQWEGREARGRSLPGNPCCQGQR